MIKNILVVTLLLLSISTVSAFCVVRGYILDNDGDAVNATKINIVCKRAEGELISQLVNTSGYLYPFGDWYDDCTYCDQGVYVSIFEENKNLFGEQFNSSCGDEVKICHNDIYMNQISEPISEKEYYDTKPDLGPLTKEPIVMPKSNESPQTKVPGIKEDFYPDYTYLYVLAGIAFIIIFILIINMIRKHGR